MATRQTYATQYATLKRGHALFSRPLEERRHILQELRPVVASDAVKLTESFPATQSRRLMEACAAMGSRVSS